MRFAQVEARYKNMECVAIGEVSFHNQGRSRVMLVNQGKMRVYAEQGTGLFIGAEIIGPAAEHLAHRLVGLAAPLPHLLRDDSSRVGVLPNLLEDHITFRGKVRLAQVRATHHVEDHVECVGH